MPHYIVILMGGYNTKENDALAVLVKTGYCKVQLITRHMPFHLLGN